MTSCLIADAGPLIALAHIDQCALPRRIRGRCILPQTVHDELVGFRDKPGVSRIMAAVEAGHFEISPDPAIPENLGRSLLDGGECAAIALALERGAMVLVDDLMARRVARRLGLRVTGTCGMLVVAKKRGLVSRVGPLLEQLILRGYFISDSLRKHTLDLAGEA